MKILFIGVSFYEYNSRIIEKAKEMGNEIDVFIPDDCQVSINGRLMRKIDKSYIPKEFVRRQSDFIDRVKNEKRLYDIIVVVKGNCLTDSFLKNLKMMYYNTPFVLYLWDSIKRSWRYEKIKKYFDRIYTFDPVDADKYKIKFLHTFYLDEYVVSPRQRKDIDIFFSGYNHSGRDDFLELIYRKASRLNLKCNFYLVANLKDKILKKIWLKGRWIHYNTMTLEKNAEYTKRSKIVIDLQHPDQTGLTLRCLEALASKCKLITTNKHICKYDFYNEKNICIVDQSKANVPDWFFLSNYEEVDDSVLREYCLKKWWMGILAMAD